MEYTVDSMGPFEESNVLQKFWRFVTSPNHKRTIGILGILTLVAAVPLTSYIAQQQTRTRQQAAANGTVQIVQQSGEPFPNNRATTEHVALKIYPPDGWQLANAQSQKNLAQTLVKKAYAAACVSPSVCSTDPNPSGFTRTDGVCEEHPETGETMYCYIRNGTSGPAATNTPTPSPTPSGGGGGSQAARCSSLSVSPNTATNSQTVTATLIYTGDATWVELWVNDLSLSSPQVNNGWRQVGTRDSNISGGTKTMSFNTTGLSPGDHFVAVRLLSTNNETDDQFNPNCVSRITIGNSQPRVCEAYTNCYDCINAPRECGWAGGGQHEGSCQTGTSSCPANQSSWYFNSCSTNQCNAQPPPTNITLRQVHIQNIGAGSGGSSNARITGNDLNAYKKPGGFLLIPWRLNALGSGETSASRGVKVDLYEQPDPNPGGHKDVSTTITLARSSGSCPAGTPQLITISGTITSSGGGTSGPVTGAVVCANTISTNTCSDIPSNLNGGYEIRSLPAGGAGHTIFIDPSTISRHGLVDPNPAPVVFPACQNTANINFNLVAGPTATPTPTHRPGDPTRTPTPADSVCTALTTCGNCTASAGCFWAYRGTTAGGGECRLLPALCTNGDVSYAINQLGSTRSCSSPTSCTVPGVATPTARPSGTLTPTATPTITPTATITPTEVPNGDSKVTFSLNLQGIGNGGLLRGGTNTGNQSPRHPRLPVTVLLFAPGADPKTDAPLLTVQRSDALIYTNGIFTAQDFDLGTSFTPRSDNQYQVLVRIDKYLRKRLPGIKTITRAQTNQITSSPVLLIAGDLNKDGRVDVFDYANEWLPCFGHQTTECITRADINDDGIVDDVTNQAGKRDYDILLNALSVQEGD